MARICNPGFRNHSNFPSYSCRNHKSPADDHRGRPPDVLEDHRRRRPNFIVKLSPLPGDTFNYRNSGVIQSVLVKHCKFRPYDVVFEWKSSSILLYYIQWICAREGVVKFWEALFNGEHNLTPILIRNVIVPSDVDEVNDRLKPLFLAKLRGLDSGEEVKKWEEKLQSLEKEIAAVFVAMKKHQHPQLFEENRKKKEVLKSEKELIVKRIQEFKAGVRCLRCYIEGESKGGYSPYRFDDGGFDWPRIYHLIMRECRRFRDGLPVYAYRRELLREISSQQVNFLKLISFLLFF